MVKRAIQAEDSVATLVVGVIEEAIVRVLLAATLGNVHAIRQNHVVDALIRRPRNLGVLAHDIEVLGECSHPILAAELFAVLSLGNQGDNVPSVAHLTLLEQLRSRRTRDQSYRALAAHFGLN